MKNLALIILILTLYSCNRELIIEKPEDSPNFIKNNLNNNMENDTIVGPVEVSNKLSCADIIIYNRDKEKHKTIFGVYKYYGGFLAEPVGVHVLPENGFFTTFDIVNKGSNCPGFPIESEITYFIEVEYSTTNPIKEPGIINTIDLNDTNNMYIFPFVRYLEIRINENYKGGQIKVEFYGQTYKGFKVLNEIEGAHVVSH